MPHKRPPPCGQAVRRRGPPVRLGGAGGGGLEKAGKHTETVEVSGGFSGVFAKKNRKN